MKRYGESFLTKVRLRTFNEKWVDSSRMQFGETSGGEPFTLSTRIRRLGEWLSEDADAMWKDATLLERAAENQRRELYGQRRVPEFERL